MTIQTPSGAMTSLLTEFDAKSQTVTLTIWGDKKWRAALRYARPANDALVPDGAYRGEAVRPQSIYADQPGISSGTGGSVQSIDFG